MLPQVFFFPCCSCFSAGYFFLTVFMICTPRVTYDPGSHRNTLMLPRPNEVLGQRAIGPKRLGWSKKKPLPRRCSCFVVGAGTLRLRSGVSVSRFEQARMSKKNGVGGKKRVPLGGSWIRLPSPSTCRVSFACILWQLAGHSFGHNVPWMVIMSICSSLAFVSSRVHKYVCVCMCVGSLKHIILTVPQGWSFPLIKNQPSIIKTPVSHTAGR